MAIAAPRTSLTDRLASSARAWTHSQYELVTLSVELVDSPEWVLAGSPTPAHHLAAVCDIEACTAREWIRVGTRVRGLPTICRLFADGTLSYSKVRALVSIATPANEAELATLAAGLPASRLRAELARWLGQALDADELADHHHRQRSAKWRLDPNGMVTFTLRLPPHLAAVLIALLTAIVMRSTTRRDASAAWPTLAQQHADAFIELIGDRASSVVTEVVLHVRGDGCTTDDGTPIADTVVAELAPHAFLRANIHDAAGRPVDASARRRHPTTRQKRVVKERDLVCVDCGRPDLLEYDHNPPFEATGRTVTGELELRCGPCHRQRHAATRGA